MESGHTTPLERVGQRLRHAREAAGLSVRDVSDHIRVRVALLEALEGGNREELPADVFVRGFVKSYARVVGIDPEEFRGDMEKALGIPVTAPAQASTGSLGRPLPSIPTLKANKPHPYTVSGRAKGRVAFAVVLVVILGLILVTRYLSRDETADVQVASEPPIRSTPATGNQNPPDSGAALSAGGDTAGLERAESPVEAEEGVLGEPVEPVDESSSVAEAPTTELSAQASDGSISAGTVQASPPPTQTVPPVPAPPQSPPLAQETVSRPPRPPVIAGFGGRSVIVNATAESWIIIYQDGKSVYERLMRGGERLEYRFEGEAELTAGNPSVVQVILDGQPAPPFRKKSSPSRIKLSVRQ